MRYDNFDISIKHLQNQQYLVIVETTRFGETQHEVEINLQEGSLATAVKHTHKNLTSERKLVELGTLLFDLLFDKTTQALFYQCYGLVKKDKNAGLRIRISIDSPELAVVPWELLYSPNPEGYLAARVKTPVIRYLAFAGDKPSLLTEFPVRILLVAPVNSGLDTAAKEIESLKQTVQQLDGNLELISARDAAKGGPITLDLLEELVGLHRINILHFIGHGQFDNGKGQLFLDDGAIDDQHFARLFINTSNLSLVVLNSCEGARQAQTSVMTGTAASLVKAGIPAVVAMQYEILDEAAEVFSTHFYRSLCSGPEAGRVEHAISIARNALIMRFPGTREAATPVLFTHTDESVLFVNKDVKPLGKRSLDTLDTAIKQQERAEAQVDSEQTPSLVADKSELESKANAARKTSRISILATVLAIVAVGLGLFYAIKPSPPPQVPSNPERIDEINVKVPNVVGIPLSRAVAQLKARKIRSVFPKTNRNAIVTAQSIPAGQLAKQGASIQLEVEVEPQVKSAQVEVPDVIGMNDEKAILLLREMNLRTQVETRRQADGNRQVLNQSPAAGKRVAPGSRVKLLVAVRGVLVPNVVGMPLEEALAKLESLRLIANIPQAGRSGTIIKQSINPGEAVKRGTKINLTIELESNLVEVPDLTGLDAGKAHILLRELNLNPQIRTQRQPGGNRQVLKQSPAAGARVKPKSNISLLVAERGVLVPDVVGLTARDALNSLKSQGLSVSYSQTEIDGVVTGQSIKSGEIVKPRETVKLQIAK